MTTGTDLVKANGIGLSLADDLSREQKMELVLAYTETCMAPFVAQAVEALSKSDGFIINNEGDRKLAASETVELRQLLKKIDGFRETYLRPTKRDIRTIEAKIGEAEKKVKQAIGVYDDALKEIYLKEEAAREAAQALEFSRAEKNDDVPMVFQQTDKTIRTEIGTATLRKTIKISVSSLQEVILGAATGEIPCELLTVDLGAAKRYFESSKIKKAPGFVIEDDAIVAGRG